MSNLKDYATSTVAVAPSPASSGTTLEVETGHGARFPSAPFYITVHPPFEFPTLDNAEKMLVTAKSGDEFTIDRAEGDTTAKSIEAGWRVSNSLFLGDIPADFDDLANGATNVAFTTTLKSKLDNVEANADVTDATNVAGAGAVMESDTSTADMDFVVDEDDMSSNSATKLSTQQSIKAYVDNAISTAKQALLPVGSIVVLGVSTNPNTLYGFGTWTAIAGRVLVGYDAGQTEFDTLDETGGAKTHAHSLSDAGQAQAFMGTSALIVRNVAGSSGTWAANRQIATTQATSFTSTQGVALQGTTDDGSTLQPYIVKYMWQRTA